MPNQRAFADDDPRIKELVSLRARRGLSEAGAQKCRALLTTLELTAPRLVFLIKRELQRMKQDRYVEALRFAYAVRDEPGETLGERRDAFLKSLPKSDRRHEDTLDKWERDAIDELLGRLIDAAKEDSLDSYYLICVTATYSRERRLTSITEDHMTDYGTAIRRIWSRSWINDDGEGGIDTGRAFYYQVPRDIDNSIQVHPILLHVLFAEQPLAVLRAEGRDVVEAQIAHRVPLAQEVTSWTDGLDYYRFSTLLKQPVPGWVVAFFWRVPEEPTIPLFEIWREFGIHEDFGPSKGGWVYATPWTRPEH